MALGFNAVCRFGTAHHSTRSTQHSTFLKVITRWTDVPPFDSEESEARFWADARLDARLMNSAVVKTEPARESTTITLRFDPRMLNSIKRLARSRYLNYQSMIKQWLAERMEKELGDRS